MPTALTGTAELNAMIERVAPDILELLADGVPRTKATIVEALAGRHDKQDVVHALIRLAVTGPGRRRPAASTRWRRLARAPEGLLRRPAPGGVGIGVVQASATAPRRAAVPAASGWTTSSVSLDRIGQHGLT